VRPKSRATSLLPLLVSSIAASHTSAADVGETVAEFYESCTTERGRVNGRCGAYIEGAADALAAFGNGGHPGGICGRGYDKGELTRIFLEWFPANRHVSDSPRLAGVTLALRARYPCRMN
jgi:hypothetical protein